MKINDDLYSYYFVVRLSLIMQSNQTLKEFYVFGEIFSKYQGSAWDGMGRKKSSHGINFLALL
jgi:hypothetical protein